MLTVTRCLPHACYIVSTYGIKGLNHCQGDKQEFNISSEGSLLGILSMLNALYYSKNVHFSITLFQKEFVT